MKKTKAKKLQGPKGVFDRRDFLLTSATALGGMFLPQWSQEALANGSQEKVVVVFLRGGMDGKSLLLPHRAASGTQSENYRQYAASRRELVVENPKPLPNCPNFDLSPNAPRLLKLWNDSDAIFIPGAGSSNTTRSHFVQQDLIENGNPDGGSPNGGFLNRALSMIPEGSRSPDMPAVSIGSGVHKSLQGEAHAVCVPNLSTGLSVNGIDAGVPLDTRLQKLWTGVQYLSPNWVDWLLKKSGGQAGRSIDVIREAAQISSSQISPTSGDISENQHHYAGMNQFPTALRLLKTDPNIRYLTINVEGWDHHAGLGPNYGGTFHNLMAKLDRALGAFAYDLNRAGMWNNVRVVVMSEFGRRLQINGAAGTDHGRGGLMMVLGGNLKGKRVLQRNWSLRSDHLEQGDVKVTVDYRDVLSELLVKFQGISLEQLKVIFPGYVPKFLGIV